MLTTMSTATALGDALRLPALSPILVPSRLLESTFLLLLPPRWCVIAAWLFTQLLYRQC